MEHLRRILLLSHTLCLSLLLCAQSIVQIGADIDGEAAYDGSGLAISLSADGTRLAVGAGSNSGNGLAAGHVRVYDLIGGVWTQLGVDLDGDTAGEAFGGCVALSADGLRLAIGIPRHNGPGSDAGQVKVYDESGGVWIQVGQNIDGLAPTDWCGESIALSADGTRLVVGAQLNDAAGSQAGHVRVFDLIGGIWVPVGAPIQGIAGATLGKKVAISADGQRVATNSLDHVQVYTFDGINWLQLGADLIGEDPSDGFAWSISLSADGTRLAVGAPFNDGNGIDAGHARVYSETGGVWTQVGADIDGAIPDEWAGFSVVLIANGSRVAVSAPYHPGSLTQEGRVRMYTETAGVWTQWGPTIVGEAPADYSGSGITFSATGDTIAIGAHWNDDSGINAGHVRVFSITPTNISVPDHDAASTLLVQPNPTNGNLVLSTSQTCAGRVLIMDPQGRVLLEQPFRSMDVIDFDRWPDGCYVVTVQCGNRVHQQRIVVAH